jgi:anthranilate synthase/aminodeoxychorismate synthase-like glutamine amidotransferase
MTHIVPTQSSLFLYLSKFISQSLSLKVYLSKFISQSLSLIMSHVLLIDNYDSFTYNLAQQILKYTSNIKVVRNDQIKISEILAGSFTHIIISPGPGHPQNANDFGINQDILEYLSSEIPILGVCLGYQGMAAHFGAEIMHAPTVMHGKTSFIAHQNTHLFNHIQSPMQVMRYHSLCVKSDTLPSCLQATAYALDDDVLMAFQHKKLPCYGVQFHPESIATLQGSQLIKNFLNC